MTLHRVQRQREPIKEEFQTQTSFSCRERLADEQNGYNLLDIAAQNSPEIKLSPKSFNLILFEFWNEAVCGIWSQLEIV